MYRQLATRLVSLPGLTPGREGPRGTSRGPSPGSLNHHATDDQVSADLVRWRPGAPADQEPPSYEALAALVVSLRGELARAQERIAELEDRLRKTSRNSSMPPSGEGLAKPAPRSRSLRKKTGRKPAERVGRRPVGNVRNLPAGGYRLRFRRNGEMRTSPEVYAMRADAMRALWKMADDGRAGCHHDRRFRALVLLVTFASLRWGEAP